MKDIALNKNEFLSNSNIVPINIKEKEFDILMNIYTMAINQVLDIINGIQTKYKSVYEDNIINHTTSRIKAPESIIKKMQKKKLELSYRNLVDNINDIAGVRVVCPTKDNIYTIVKIIEKIPNWRIIKLKDYIKSPKKSGYSGYHIIVEVPILMGNKNCKEIFVKVEIQIRTMAMDFWATNEHKMKYKTNKRLSYWDSKRLMVYAKILKILDDKFMKINQKMKVKNMS